MIPLRTARSRPRDNMLPREVLSGVRPIECRDPAQQGVKSVRPPQPILTAQIASRVDLVHPVSKEGGYGSAGGSAEVFGVAATAEAV
jgi:hypothetical protein